MFGKYVMLDYRFPILFPEMLTHKSVEGFASMEKRPITSAGFFSFFTGTYNDGRVRVFGESKSLGMKPAPEDAEFIELFITGLHNSAWMLVNVNKENNPNEKKKSR